MFRRLIRSAAAQAAFAWLLGLYLACVYRTTRWTLLGKPRCAPPSATRRAGPAP